MRAHVDKASSWVLAKDRIRINEIEMVQYFPSSHSLQMGLNL